MTHAEFVSSLAQRMDWTSEKTEDMTEALIALLNDKLSESAQITIQNIGVFETRKNNEYIRKNADSGERFLIPPKISVVFKSAATLRENLKKAMSDE